jgi:large subunit ribosomal protein L24
MRVKVKKGDTVQILAGKDRGKRGTVARVYPQTAKVIVEGLNLVKKHRRARKAAAAGIVTIAAPLPLSRVMVVCPHCAKSTRIQVRVNDDTSRSRVCQKCHEPLSDKETK